MGNRVEKIQKSCRKKNEDFWKLNKKYHAVRSRNMEIKDIKKTGKSKKEVHKTISTIKL